MAGMGLIRVESNDQIAEREAADARRRDETRSAAALHLESRLSAHIRRHWERNRRAKEPVRQRLLACLRQRNGEYGPADLQAIREQGGSEIFMMLTATKVRAAKGWVRDILLPATGDKPWGLEPTPVPDIPPELMRMIHMRVAREAEVAAQQGQPIDPAAETERWVRRVKKLAEDRAEKATRAHEDKIEDQLAEGRWEESMDEFIDDFVTFPSAILKGPVLKRRPTFRWGPGMRPVPSVELRFEFERVSPFDLYPSPLATDTQEGNLIERVRYSRGELYRLIGHPGYDGKAIRAVLEEYGRGGLREWLWDEAERRQAEGAERVWHDDDQDTIDALHYWGSAQGLMLLEWGVDPSRVPDVLGEYEIEAVLIGRHVIRAEINDDPLFRRPYHKASWQPKPGAFWGVAVPELMADIQRVCNATARSLVNNMAISSGPQVEVYGDMLADGEDITSMYPWKIWQMKRGDGITQVSGNARAIQFFQPTSNAQELMGVYQEFERRADEATNIPRYTYGDERVGGAGRTASGLSMLLDAATKTIKAAIANVDLRVVRPAVEMLWFANMLHDPDPSIKCDTKVVARGTAALVARDQRAARLTEMLSMTTNEVDMQILGIDRRAKMLRELFQAGGIDPDYVPNQEEIRQRQQQQAQQPSPEELEAQREDLRLQLEAQDKERQYGLDLRRLALEIEDTRFDNRLEARRFEADRRERGREQRTAA